MLDCELHSTVHAYPALSPRADLVAYGGHGRDGTRQICIANTGGFGRRQVTDNGKDCYFPSFSPTSRQIAFLKAESGKNSVCIVDLDTGEELTIARGAAKVRPAWRVKD
jgi:Tol biopolymer transport system component